MSTWMLRPGAAAVLALAIACGGSPPTKPGPTPPPGPPANAQPSITGMSVQTRRAGAPATFANVGDTLDVSATVTDAETAPDQLTYEWSAPVGTFTGTGRTVTWTAPAMADAPATITLTLKVVDNYGHPGQPPAWRHEVTGTTTVRLHDTSREVGKMATDFLTAFSQPQTIKDWQVVMKDFDLNGGTCKDPGEITSERRDVERHYNNFVMHTYNIGTPVVTVAFGQQCAIPTRNPKAGDACAAVPIMWDSTYTPDGTRATTSGVDYLSASYSSAASRWYLCSSDFIPNTTFGHTFYSGR